MIRRWYPLILISSGIFWITMALVLPLVVYPRVAVLPADPQAKQIAHGTGFNIFLPRSVDEGGIQQLRNVGVTSNVFVSADRTQGSRPANSPNAVWLVATSTVVDGHGLLETTVERVSLDRHTAHPTNCCGDAMMTEKGDIIGTPLTHRGYVFQFPFNVQKHDYPVWDGTIRDTRDAEYVGTTKKRGLTVYRFEQYVENIKTGTQDLPGSVFGSKAATVTADYMYRTHRTYWVEPNSGGIVDYREAMDRRFLFQGKELPVIQGTLTLVPASGGDDTFKLIKFAAVGLPLLRHTIPVIFGPIGVLSIILGVVLHWRRLRKDSEEDEWHEGPWLGDDDEGADEPEPAPASGRRSALWNS
jgi:DUF3068 family protein